MVVIIVAVPAICVNTDCFGGCFLRIQARESPDGHRAADALTMPGGGRCFHKGHFGRPLGCGYEVQTWRGGPQTPPRVTLAPCRGEPGQPNGAAGERIIAVRLIQKPLSES